MKTLSKIFGLLLLMALAAFSQDRRDFLTEDEADQIREAQEPNERLALYLKFARLRLELVRQALAAEKPGRAKLIHDNLEDYTRIVEAMDSVIDDALARKMDLQKSMGLVAAREKEFIGMLQGFSGKPAKDRSYYEFALKDALDTTQDSLEESQQDLKARAQRVLSEDARDKKKRESEMSAAEQAQRKAERQEAEDKASRGSTRKPPTLRRKGEAPPDQ